MSLSSEKVKRWRRKNKERIIDAFGGMCGVCGYNKCNDALALHHIDPSQKEFGIGSARKSPKSWHKIVEELRKCVLLCHNCHSEYHSGLISIPENINTFNEEFAVKKTEFKFEKFFCPCGTQLGKRQRKYCSMPCCNKYKQKIDWNKFDLRALCSKHPTTHVAKMIGVSDNAIRKRLKKMNKEKK